MTIPAEGGALAKFFAKKVVEGFPGNKDTKNAAVSEIELANRISEIMIETQVAGASFLKAHIIDPELALAVSGWLEVKEGLLQPIEVEFPSGSGWHWMLCAVEGSTNVQDANLIVTFEDRIIYFLRQYYGTKFAPAGIQTRAQFIRGLVREIGSHGEPRAGFICPSLNVVQPLETEAQAESKKTHTAQDKQEKEEAQAKRGGVGAGSIMIEGQPVTRQKAVDIGTALQTAARLKAGTIEVEALIAAGIAESGFDRSVHENHDPNNPHQGIWQSQTIPGSEVARQAEHFLIGGESFKAGGAKGRVAAGIKNPAQIGVEVEIGGSQSSMERVLPEARKIIAESGVITAGTAGSTEESATSDVGQLQRGTSGNPDEDSFECAVRLATQVSWFFFSDNHNFFYMDGPDLMKQKPALYVDVVNNRIRFPDGTKREGVIHAPTTFHYDNTTFQYRVSHKLTKRTQRKSKAIKPASPAEVKLLIECDINQFHAGEAMRIVNSGPMNGQWIITNTRRECLKDIYTEIILEPPVEPLPEPKSTGGEEGAEPGGANPEGYVNPFSKISGLTPERIDMGVDYAGKGTVLALGDGEITFSANHTGWEGGGAIVYKLTSGTYAGKYVFVAENVVTTINKGTKVKAGAGIATMTGGIETGWASGNADEPLASSLGQQGSGDPGGVESPAGASFNRFLVSLGCPSGTKNSGGLSKNGQPMPPGYP